MVWSAPNWPIPVPFCGMDQQKSNFSLISDTLSVGGYWGQPMSFFWKPVDETQMSKPPETTTHHKSIKLLILLPLRADLSCFLQYETPCMYNYYSNSLNFNFSPSFYFVLELQYTMLLLLQWWQTILTPLWLALHHPRVCLELLLHLEKKKSVVVWPSLWSFKKVSKNNW